MTSVVKTVVATGASSGIGFELVRQLLAQAPQQPYRFILGARDVGRTRAAYDAALGPDHSAFDRLTVLPLELSDLASTRRFAQQTLQLLGGGGPGGGGKGQLDYLLLNAAISNGAGEADAAVPGGPQPRGSGGRWCEALVVNHLSQHYLVHLLREELVASKARIVSVSPGAVRQVQDPGLLDDDLRAGDAGAGPTTYCQTKFVQLLGAHWWRRRLAGQCTVVAVSPGLVPDTGLGRGSGLKLTMDMPDAKSVPEGPASVLRAFTRDDFPEDPEQIFLTSWGEWWSKGYVCSDAGQGAPG